MPAHSRLHVSHMKVIFQPANGHTLTHIYSLTHTRTLTLSHTHIYSLTHSLTHSQLLDYFFFSLPLIVLCFFALGAAMGMLFGDALSRTEVTPQLLSVMEEEAKNWPAMMKMFLSVAKEKTKALADKYMPVLKAVVYSAGMAHVVTIEIGPLLTGLLLAGRIGGTYAGEVCVCVCV